MSQFTEFADRTNAVLDEVNASLNNIVSDEAGLAQSIQELKDQIAAGGSVLTPEDQAALDSVTVNAAAIAERTKAVAEAIPEVAPPL